MASQNIPSRRMMASWSYIVSSPDTGVVVPTAAVTTAGSDDYPGLSYAVATQECHSTRSTHPRIYQGERRSVQAFGNRERGYVVTSGQEGDSVEERVRAAGRFR